MSNEKKLNTYRKSSQEKVKDCKRPKSTNEKVIKEQISKVKRIPKTYQSPSGISEDPKGKTKVKVYQINKDQIMNKSADRGGKHLKSKSQSNFATDSINEAKSYKPKLAKGKPKSDIYAKNFSSTEYYKYKIGRDSTGREYADGKIMSPQQEQKSPDKATSNFSNIKKVIKKVNQAIGGNRPQYTRKYDRNLDDGKNNSLIAESGGSGMFQNNRSKGKKINSYDLETNNEDNYTIKDGIMNRNEADNAARMNFYPIPAEEPEIDFESLELHEANEEFKVTRLQNKLKEKSQSNTSPNASKEEVQTIPEYYFDLTRTGNNKPAFKENRTIPVKTHTLHNAHIRR